MNIATPAVRRAATISALLMTVLTGLMSAQDTTPPHLAAFSFTPGSINTASGPASVTVNFTATDNATGVFYLETSFVDPTGVFVRRGSTRVSPTVTLSGSLSISFPRFSNSGAWTVGSVFLADAAGNTTVLDTAALSAAGFPTVLQVNSAVDNTPPGISAFTINPSSINTTSAPAGVTVNFTLTDDLSGPNLFQVSLVSPSGATTQRASVNLTPATTVSGSAGLTFPKGSEAGTWTVAGAFVSDAAGNTLSLDTAGLTASGFPTSLNVISTTDTTPPNLTGFSFTPSSINTTSASAGMSVAFAATDDLSGVKSFQVTLMSPSGVSTLQGNATVTPATTVTGSTAVIFPGFSEAGQWTVASVFLADAAGNTSVLDTSQLAAKGFPTTFTVTSTTDSTPPNITAFSFAPSSINVGPASATVTVSFHLTDDLSGAKSFQVTFLSPSGTSQQTATTSFAPSNSVTASVNVGFPRNSETGTWTVGNVFVVDAAGNTLTLQTGDLLSRGFPTQLTVTSTGSSDTTPPAIVPHVTPAPGTGGWNTTTPVTVTWTVTDPETGITSSSGCGATTLSAETAGQTFTCTATNGAGLTGSASVTVKIDTTRPVITPTVTPAPNAAGWNNTDVTVTWSVTDSISGIASSVGCSPATISTNTAGATLACSATNGAGLTASASTTVKLDKTGPTISGMPAPGSCELWPPNGKFSQVANVTAADALSGLAAGTFTVTGSSNEPSDPSSPDIVITPTNSGGYTIQLRADRLGTGTGRIYTLTATAKDVAGNATTVTGTCTVPHDKGN